MSENHIHSILQIPGNELVYNNLKNLLLNKQALAFLGAGISAPLYPLWDQLINKMAENCLNQGLATDSDYNYWIKIAPSRPIDVANRIRSKMGDSAYHAFLFETFKDRNGSDGLTYTKAQAEIMKSNFKGWITTNYDPGILEARRNLRKDNKNTSFSVWNQNPKINHWASGDVFKRTQEQPILFAHGHFDDPSNIVLDSESYSRAYKSGPYSRFVQNLWFQENLIFIGFGFKDSVLNQIANEVLKQTAFQGGGAARHVAIIGLPIEDGYTEEMRRTYLDCYHAEALFFPVHKTKDGGADYAALTDLLESLSKIGEDGKNINAATSNPIKKRTGELHKKQSIRRVKREKIVEYYVHETTDDSKFVGRDNELADC